MGMQEQSRILAVFLLFPSSGLYWRAGKQTPQAGLFLSPWFANSSSQK